MAASLIAPMVPSLMQSFASSLKNAITGKGVRRTGKGQKCGFLSLLALPLMMKVLEKESQEQEEHMARWIIYIKIFSPTPFFKQYRYYRKRFRYY